MQSLPVFAEYLKWPAFRRRVGRRPSASLKERQTKRILRRPRIVKAPGLVADRRRYAGFAITVLSFD